MPIRKECSLNVLEFPLEYTILPVDQSIPLSAAIFLFDRPLFLLLPRQRLLLWVNTNANRVRV